MKFFSRIHGRLVISSVLMIFPTFLIIVAFSLIYIVKEEHERSMELVGESLLQHELLIENYFKAGIADLMIVSHTPPVDGIVRAIENGGVDPFDDTHVSVWLDQLAVIMNSLLVTRDMWYQARFLDANGDELLRLQTIDHQIVVMPQSHLQNKSGEYYFGKAKSMHAHEVYISNIDLNREDGKVEIPYKPTVRFASPVFHRNGDFAGMLVLNAHASPILHPEWLTSKQYWAFVLDEKGYYMLNEDDHLKEWGDVHDLGTDVNAMDDFGDAYQGIVSGENSRITYNGRKNFVLTQKIMPYPVSDRYLVVGYMIPQAVVATNMMDVMVATVIVLFLGLFFTIGITMATGQTLSKPLYQMLDSVVKFREGDLQSRAPLNGPTEMQQLASCLNDMSDSIVARQMTLEQEVLERTSELDDSRRAALSMMQDAHIQRERAEEAIKKLETANQEMLKLTQAIEQSPAMVMIMNTDGKIEYANPSFYFITGYTSQDIMGQNMRILFAEDQLELNIDELCTFVMAGNDWSGETMNIKKDGTIYWEFANISPIRNDAGDITSYIAVKEDVTESKKAAIELQRAKDDAEAANKSKSDFLANMSHEIRTPMNAILGMSHLLYKTGLNPRQSEYVKKIENALKNLLGIINDILDFSKIEAGKMELEIETFKIDTVLQNIIDLIHPKIQEKDIELIISKAPDVPRYVIGDQLRLSQILLNLANNAVKFTHDGEIVIFIETKAKADNSITLQFTVKDTGVGLTKTQHSKLFEAFHQADTSITRKYGGTGLGLIISKRLVELMQGNIWVESEYGKGSSFHFTATFNYDETPANDINYKNDQIANLRVLVVDDNLTSQKIIEEMLSSFSVQAEFFATSDELIDHFENNTTSKVDAVFLDWRLPKVNGVDTYGILQEKFEHLPPFVLMSAFSTELMYTEAHKQGFWAILEKPIGRSEIFHTLLSIVQKNSQEIVTRSKIEDISDLLDPIRGARLLLVEDNEINRQVAMEILSGEGFDLEMAENGQVALEQLRNDTQVIDLVLMDLHMPVMDGYTTTHELRKIDRYKKLPIIAMTADAIVGVHQQCLDAGMNDYISKPVNPYELFRGLAKWIKPVDEDRRRKGQAKIKAQIVPQTPEIIDSLQRLMGLNVDAALKRLNNNMQLYIELLVKFKRNYLDFQQTMEKSLLENDTISARRMAHTLKGIAGNLGFDALYSKANHLQKAIEQNDHKKIKSIFESTIQEIDVIFSIINESDVEIRHTPAAQKISEKNKQKLLEEMHGLLKNHDIRAKQFFKDNEAGFLSSLLQHDFAKLHEYIERYNFSDAQSIIAAVMNDNESELGVE